MVPSHSPAPPPPPLLQATAGDCSSGQAPASAVPAPASNQKTLAIWIIIVAVIGGLLVLPLLCCCCLLCICIRKVRPKGWGSGSGCPWFQGSELKVGFRVLEFQGPGFGEQQAREGTGAWPGACNHLGWTNRCTTAYLCDAPSALLLFCLRPFRPAIWPAVDAPASLLRLCSHPSTLLLTPHLLLKHAMLCPTAQEGRRQREGAGQR